MGETDRVVQEEITGWKGGDVARKCEGRDDFDCQDYTSKINTQIQANWIPLFGEENSLE